MTMATRACSRSFLARPQAIVHLLSRSFSNASPSSHSLSTLSIFGRLRPLSAAVSVATLAPVIWRHSLQPFSTRSTTSSLNDPNPNWSNRPPKETILLDGCDFEHWLVVMEKPEGEPTRDEIIDSYIKTLAQVVGSEEEARMKIYSVSTRHYYAFGALVSEELSYKLKELPRVRWVLPDSYLDVKNKDYGGEPFINGQAVPYDPKYHEEWVRNNARAQERNRRNDRPRNFDRSRNFQRRENFQSSPSQVMQNTAPNMGGTPPRPSMPGAPSSPNMPQHQAPPPNSMHGVPPHPPPNSSPNMPQHQPPPPHSMHAVPPHPPPNSSPNMPQHQPPPLNSMHGVPPHPPPDSRPPPPHHMGGLPHQQQQQQQQPPPHPQMGGMPQQQQPHPQMGGMPQQQPYPHMSSGNMPPNAGYGNMQNFQQGDYQQSYAPNDFQQGDYQQSYAPNNYSGSMRGGN